MLVTLVVTMHCAECGMGLVLQVVPRMIEDNQ